MLILGIISAEGGEGARVIGTEIFYSAENYNLLRLLKNNAKCLS
jgi:hypothetical protein